jgi:hypothetical protein
LAAVAARRALEEPELGEVGEQLVKSQTQLVSASQALSLVYLEQSLSVGAG